MIAFESPQFRSTTRPSHLHSVGSSEFNNDGFFWEHSSMVDPYSNFSAYTGHHHPSLGVVGGGGAREHRRFSYAGTTGTTGNPGSGLTAASSGHDSGLHSTVSSLLHGSDADHLMDSMSSMASSHVGGGGNSTPEQDLWMHHGTPPHSAPPIPRNEPTFEYFGSGGGPAQQAAVSGQSTLPTFQDAYISNATMTLRPSIWTHPSLRAGASQAMGSQDNLAMNWANTSGAIGSSGRMSVQVDEYPSGGGGGSRIGLPWSQEQSKKYPDPAGLFGVMQQHQLVSAGNMSDSSSDAGSISSPVMSPGYNTTPSAGAQYTTHFNFPGHHHHHNHQQLLSSSAHSALHRTKSSPTTFGRSSDQQGNAAPEIAGQVCAVCGDHAACQHYGVRTCEGCKGFFKRTVQKGSKYVCLGNRDCLVDKKRRNRCQFCRYQKCLTVGMVKEVVRTDSLKGRRGRLPSKPKNLSENSSRAASRRSSACSVSSVGPKVDFIGSLLRAHQECLAAESVDCQNLDATTIKSAQEEIERFLSVLTHSLTEMMQAWVEFIPVELAREDRDILINSAALELLSLRMSYRLLTDTAVGPDRVRFCGSGVVYPKEQINRVMGSWFSELEQLSRSLQNMDLDAVGFACLCALVIFQDRPFLMNNAPVLNLQTKIVNALRDYTTCNAQGLHNWFPHLFGRLQDAHTIGEHVVHRLRFLHGQIPPVNFPEALQQCVTHVADR